MSLPIRLKYAIGPRRAASAWLVRSPSAADWVAAAAALAEDQLALRFLVLPGEGAHALGALILAPQSTDRSAPPASQAYGFVAERFLIPVEAVLDPPPTDDELRAMTGAESLLVWHPSGGLVRFEASRILTLLDLLAAPAEAAADWSAARTAPAFVDRLQSVSSAEPPPSMDDLVNAWHAERGDPRPLRDLPRTPNEGKMGLRERWGRALSKFQEGLKRWRTAKKPGETPERPKPGEAPGRTRPQGAAQGESALGRLLGGVAGSLAAGMGAALAASAAILEGMTRGLAGLVGESSRRGVVDQGMRDREVARLLHLLEHDPEDGLRFAIPLAGTPGRGEGVAGNQLVAGNGGFHLYPGGGAVDPWTISPQQQMQLNRRYRELAEKAVREGRHRQAAYIYSQLLGDWHAAANALKAGHYYAEAAVVYLERLHNLIDAARCYDLAGLHDDALRLYRQQNQWVVSGDLCARLGRTEEAESDYHVAVDKAVIVGDLRLAADVLETKLQKVSAALTLLEGAWPTHSQAEQHTDHWFAIAARHQRHDDARQRVDSIAAATPPAVAPKLLARLQHVRHNYPSTPVQEAAEKNIWQVIGQHLPDASQDHARLLTSHLPTLLPNDRLVSRDCDRYLNLRREPESRTGTSPARGPQLRIENEFAFSAAPLADPILACDAGLVAVTEAEGNATQQLCLASADEPLGHRSLERTTAHPGYTLVALDAQRRSIWIHPSGAECQITWPGRSEVWRVQSPSFLPEHWLAVEPTASGMTQVLWIDPQGMIWLTRFTSDGGVSRSVNVAEDFRAAPGSFAQLARGRATVTTTGSDTVFLFLPISDGDILGECYDAEGLRLWSGRLAFLSIVGPVTRGSFGMVALDEVNVALIEDVRRPQHNGPHSGPISTGWSNPRAAILPGGLFAAADEDRVAVFRADGTQLLVQRHSASAVRAVHATGIGRFCIVREGGDVEAWTW